MSGPTYAGLDKGYIVNNSVPEFTVVMLAGQENVASNDNTALAIGVCQEHIVETVDFGRRVANIRMEGITRAVSDVAIARGANVYAAANGRVTNTDATGANPKLGRCLTPSAAAGEHIDLWLTHR